MPREENARNPFRKAVQRQARFATPLGGLNFNSSTMAMPVTDAYYLDNMIPRTTGVEVRKGWQDWIPVVNRFAGEVRSIMTHNDDNPNLNTLLCSPASDGQIYDITVPNAAPVLSLTPSTTSLVQGEWYDTHFHNESGSYLCVVSAGAGYYTYKVEEIGDTVVATWDERINGVGAGFIQWPALDTHTTKDICFIWMWKSRLWFLVKDSPVAYYLPIGALTGALKAFDFGQLMQRGGPMSFGATWTYDSGNGVDDSLVMVSAEGEVLIYDGTDPDIATEFKLRGVWYIGHVPYGRRGYADHGGDLLLVCEYGVVGLSDVIAGKLHVANVAGGVAEKINQRVAREISESLLGTYWFLSIFPTEEFLILGTPILTTETAANVHYLMNTINNGWCTISEMDMLCATLWNGKFLFGSRNGNIAIGFNALQDGGNSAGTVPGTEVTGRFQNAFNDFQSPNMNKRMQRVKFYGLASRTLPTFFARFLSEYELTTLIDAPGQVVGTLPLWEVAQWDDSEWAQGGASFHKWFGVNGFGKKMSLQAAFRGSGRVLATDYEVLWEEGIGL